MFLPLADSEEELYLFCSKVTEVSSGVKIDFWVFNSEEVIGFIQVLEKNCKKSVELEVIEVKEEYRGKGYSKKIFSLIEAARERKLIHLGCYTDTGLERLSKYFFPDVDSSDWYSVGDKIFVKNWDSLELNF